MKILLTALCVFILAFAATLLFELDFITRNPVRYALVVLLVVCILLVGVKVLKAMVFPVKKEE
jgi:hypothetical protein